MRSLRETSINILRHPFMVITSIVTVTFMLVLLGAFAVFSINADLIVRRAAQQPPIEIFSQPGLDKNRAEKIRLALEERDDVIDLRVLSPEENLEEFRRGLGEDGAKTLQYYDARYLPWSFIVRLSDPNPEQAAALAAQIRGVPGVAEVVYNSDLIAGLSNLSKTLLVVSAVIFVILSGVALFIISGTVRASVTARGEEIEIMKYLGATNSYIRIPYMLEGALIGFTGALLACTILILLWKRIYVHLMSGTAVTSFLALMSVEQMAPLLALITLPLGVLIGSIGSVVSMRRFVKV
ncbi:MAG: ABC transporter permease [Clostridiaceae bacterium]|nr:ABC transporter permease [Clostridiaceae bacterium]